MLAKFFIERPVLANVIAFVTILLGAVAAAVLPVSQYPPITPPTVQVTTTYPGASAKTVVETVALPIEQQVNGVENMIYMQSTSTSDGTYTLIVNKDNVVEQRRVEPGQLIGELRVIRKGLTKDDRVVVGGIMRHSRAESRARSAAAHRQAMTR